MHNEGKQTNRNEKQGGNTRSSNSKPNEGGGHAKNPLDWDARDIKINGWIPGSSGDFTERFFEQEEERE